MNQKKDEDMKKLQVRLPNDEYVKLKYLAAHHGNSLNTEILAAINAAEKKARETGLYIPASELSAKASRHEFISPLQQIVDHYCFSPEICNSPVENVQKCLEDWLEVNAKLRSTLFELGMCLESIDFLLRFLKKPTNEFSLQIHPQDDRDEILLKIENMTGLPALRKNYHNFLYLVENMLPKIKDVEVVQKQLNKQIEIMHIAQHD